MSLSRAEIGLVLAEIQRLAAGELIQRIFQADPHTLILRLRYHVIELSIHPQACRVLLREEVPKKRIPVKDFAQLCRRRLEGTRFESITQPGGDRCVELRVRGPALPLSLVAELTGRHANVFLIEDSHILGSLRPNRSQRRANVIGAVYQPLAPRPDPDGAAARFESATPSAEIAALYDPRLMAWARQERERQVARPLQQQRRRLETRARRLEADLARHRAARRGQRFGDLLLAQPHLVPTRATEVHLPDLFADDPETAAPVTIPLDPRLSATANAQQHYQRAARGKRGETRVTERLDATRAETERLRASLEALSQADDETLARLVAETPDARRKATTRKQAEAARRRQPFRTFESATGARLRVGRTARDNDHLTFRTARGRDVWLHARDVPGAHVVLSLPHGGEPDHESLLDAAQLARHYSEGRDEAVVDVSWTRVKHLRRGKVPGQVYLSREHTLAVRADPARLERLLSAGSTTAQVVQVLEQGLPLPPEQAPAVGHVELPEQEPAEQARQAEGPPEASGEHGQDAAPGQADPGGDPPEP